MKHWQANCPLVRQKRSVSEGEGGECVVGVVWNGSRTGRSIEMQASQMRSVQYAACVGTLLENQTAGFSKE